MEKWNWDILLADIEGRQVVPVVGPELLEIEVGGKRTTLYQHVAEELIDRLELDRSSLAPGYDFFDVVCEFLDQQPGHPRNYPPELIYYKVREIISEGDWPVPEPLRQIASIRGFDLVVSTTCDPLMERAMREARGAGGGAVQSLAYCIRKPWEDLPDDWQEHPQPTVYQVFGKLNEMNDFALTDEDILQYAHRMQSFNRQPKNLFDEFRERRVLALGCGFSGWLTRFFLAVARGENLFQEGMPGHLADTRVVGDRSLVGFLTRKKTSVYTEGSAVEFVAELARQWSEKVPDPEPAPKPVPSEPRGEMPAESVFISFRREDREIARSVARRFKDAGLAAWFDETKLEAGDRYKEKIARNIQHCFAFVPLISKSSISSDSRPWFYRYEWKKAIEAADFRDQMAEFILPLVVDDTDPGNERIPAAFRRYQIVRLDGLDDLVAVLQRRIRQQRLVGRSQ